MKPPSRLDGARVLYWAWSGDQPFGRMRFTDGSVAAEIYGFAVCILAGTIYRFSCDRQWEVQNDSTFDTPQEAMDAAFPQYQDCPVHWEKYDDTDIEALIDGIQPVLYYREVGRRRVIQRIVTHLQQHDCHGMHVGRGGKDTEGRDVWLLWILKKDISVAQEVVERNNWSRA